jgi:hypothetical protein
MKTSWINRSTRDIEIVGSRYVLASEAYCLMIPELFASHPAPGVLEK